MQIGIGLPSAIRSVNPDELVEWARRADEAGFSTLAVIDRVIYPNYEPLVTLAAAAAVTERIRLATDVLVGPLRTNTALLAKQALSVDNLSKGRLVLGLGVGAREEDFDVSGVPLKSRGRIFDRQLAELTEFWARKDDFGPSSYQGARPTVLIGGRSESAYLRAARYADGWTQGSGTPAMFAESLGKLRATWRSLEREGEPRTMALFYFGLGSRARQNAENSVGDYYSFLGSIGRQLTEAVATDEDSITRRLADFASVGVDEVVCFPTSPDIVQLNLLAQLVL
jgi:alkanesulfonate monooxygenase SsuD/methylene tetrahydromethanopterin reductase-like flavin-dependent oxidoreductase (luciferase family)